MISVCLATYNGEKYIKEQLESILLQLQINDEIIVSDDNSLDHTLKIIREFKDNRIKIFKSNGKGLISNFENALTKASGDYIFLCDQDDIWFNNKIELCVADFQKGFDLVLSDCHVFNSNTNEILHDSFFRFNNSKKGIINNLINNSYIGCCMAFRKELKNKILPFPKHIPMHDSWIGINAELYFSVNYNKNKLINYRKHSGNASDTSSGVSKYSFLKKISFRIITVYYLIARFLNREK
jgi:glycosyltransferase involved in cell wall biosynthesis